MNKRTLLARRLLVLLLALCLCLPSVLCAAAADGADTFVEIGPGRTLAGFLEKINPGVKVYHVAAWEDMESLVQ